MRILFLGDIVGKVGRKAVRLFLDKLVERYRVDFVIANGENCTHGKGLIEKHYNELIDLGIDCITLGNHYHSKDSIDDYIDDATCLIRPLNLTNYRQGVGSICFEVNNQKVRVTNILGAAFMQEEVVSPYQSLKELLDEIEGEDSIHIIDFHGEASSEKICFAYIFDGIVSAVLGTHTHVQTNDAKVLEHGTAYCTDVGMCGAANGVIGFEKNSVINKTVYGQMSRFTIDDDDTPMVNGVVMDFDNETHMCREIFLIKQIGEK